MTTKTVLTDEEIMREYHRTHAALDFARAIEQAVLQSVKVQALQKDAELQEPIINVGDMVKVVRKAEPDDWDTGWVEEMDQYIGGTFEVLEISETYGYSLAVGDEWWWFPLESLEIVV